MIVQRVLATKNIAHAKGATVMAGFLKILPMFIIVIPGTGYWQTFFSWTNDLYMEFD